MLIYGAIWAHTGPYGAIRAHMGPYGAIWDHVGPYGGTCHVARGTCSWSGRAGPVAHVMKVGPRKNSHHQCSENKQKRSYILI